MSALQTGQRLLHGTSFYVPHAVLRTLKIGARHPRYRLALARAREGHARYGDRYPCKYLFVAGLPKSGTSWLESMLACFPGYTLIPHPEVTTFDYAQGGTHAFELPEDAFSRLGDALCVIKAHCHGSPHNAAVLAGAGVPYCVMYRDLRDAAVSHVFYVKRTPWHPEYPAYRSLDTRAALLHFARTLLPQWRDWIRSWHSNRDPEHSLEVTYEALLADPTAAMAALAALYRLPLEPLRHIVERSSFDRMRSAGSFIRKGVAGDWRNHFDAEVSDAFKRAVAVDLVRWGYAADDAW
jgi:hypothetical protein